MGKYKDIKVDGDGNPEFDLSGKHEFQKLTDQREWFDYEYGVRYEVTKRPSHSIGGDTFGLMAKPSNLEEMHYWVGDFATISESEAKYRLNYRGENWLFTFTASEPYTISRAYAVPFTLNIEKERKSK